MKLQEKHLEAIVNNIPIEGSLYSDAEKAAEASAKITKDYMKRFAEWKDENYIVAETHNNGKDKFYFSYDELRQITDKKFTLFKTDELIEIFLQNETQQP